MEALGLVRIEGDSLEVLKTIDTIDKLNTIHGLVQHIITRKEAGMEGGIGLRYYDFSHLKNTQEGKRILAATRRAIDFVLGVPGEVLSEREKAYRDTVSGVSSALVDALDKPTVPKFAIDETKLTEEITSNAPALIQGAANLGLLEATISISTDGSISSYTFEGLSQSERLVNPYFYRATFAMRNNGRDILEHIARLDEDDVPVVVLFPNESIASLPRPVLDAEAKGLLQLEEIRGDAATEAFAKFFGEDLIVNLRERIKTTKDITDNKAVVEASATLL
jgi:hypothetical protein